MTPVKSSTIAAVGYNADAKQLDVQFKSGGLYRYHDVAPEAHAALVGAESVGKHFAANIKPAYKFERLPNNEEKKS